MIRKTRLFTPGPTPLLPAAQFAMAAADIHHRTPNSAPSTSAYSRSSKTSSAPKTTSCCSPPPAPAPWKPPSPTSPHPAIACSCCPPANSASAGNPSPKPSAARSTSSAHPTAKLFPSTTSKALRPETRAVFVQATESSTGVRHDIQAIGALLKEANTNALLIVDAITGLGTTHLDVDAWGIDVLIGGSQKAVMIPPGLAYLSLSHRAWRPRKPQTIRATTSTSAKSARTQRRASPPTRPRSHSSPPWAPHSTTSPPRPNGDLAAGREDLIDNAETCAAMTRAAVQALGLKLFTPRRPQPQPPPSSPPPASTPASSSRSSSAASPPSSPTVRAR